MAALGLRETPISCFHYIHTPSQTSPLCLNESEHIGLVGMKPRLGTYTQLIITLTLKHLVTQILDSINRSNPILEVRHQVLRNFVFLPNFIQKLFQRQIRTQGYLPNEKEV